MQVLRVLIVDDEAPARRRLRRACERLEGVLVAGEARDTVSLRQSLAQAHPDVILLDIAMPGVSGIEYAREPDLPPIIFTTAHSEYALDAFRVDAVDYLLKPISKEELEAALNRVRARMSQARERRVPAPLEVQVPSPGPSPPRLAARSGAVLRVFDARRISHLVATDKVVVFWVEGEEMVLDESLSALEARLYAHDFLRVHRSTLVNLAFVSAMCFGEDRATLQLHDGVTLPVSRRHLPEVKRRLSGKP